jgi:hypothetical protein
MTSLEKADPSVVLVHGAYADGSSWPEVIKLLHGAGITATAVQNQLSSLADDVAHTRWVLAQQPGPVILAGHSFAGTVISQAGTHPAVAGLVYVAARGPDAGEDYAGPGAGALRGAGTGVGHPLLRPDDGSGLAVTAGVVRGLPAGPDDLVRASAVHGRADGGDDRGDRGRPPVADHPPGRSDPADHERRPGRQAERGRPL